MLHLPTGPLERSMVLSRLRYGTQGMPCMPQMYSGFPMGAGHLENLRGRPKPCQAQSPRPCLACRCPERARHGHASVHEPFRAKALFVQEPAAVDPNAILALQQAQAFALQSQACSYFGRQLCGRAGRSPARQLQLEAMEAARDHKARQFYRQPSISRVSSTVLRL